MRNLGDAITEQALNESVLRVVALVKIEFAGYPATLFTTYHDDIEFGGETYVSQGSVGSVSNIEEDGSLSPSDYIITLDGTDVSIAAAALNAPPLNNPVTVYLQTLDENFRPQGTPFVHFKGITDGVEKVGGRTAIVSVRVKDRLADWQRPRVSRYTNAEQQLLYPNDKGFEFVETLASKEWEWPAASWFERNRD